MNNFTKIFALAAIALGLALGAQAADYTICLSGGVAYTNSVEAANVIDTTSMGLTYADGVWTMDGFNFTTTAAVAMKVTGDTTITVTGANTIAGGDSATDVQGLFFDNQTESPASVTINGTGTLTVNAGTTSSSSSKNMSVGIYATYTGVILDGTLVVNANGGVATGTTSGGFVAKNGTLAVTNATLNATGKDEGSDSSIGLTSIGAATLGGNARVVMSGKSLCFMGTPEPDAIARGVDGNQVYFDYAAYYNEESHSTYATNVVLTTVKYEPIVTEMIVAPEHTTAQVFTNGVLSAETSEGSGVWNAWSNRTATVVYTAETGYAFAGGVTAVTNAFDTAKNPATMTGSLPVATTYVRVVTADGVTTNVYATLSAAFESAPAYATISLLTNVIEMSDVSLAVGKTNTLDLAGWVLKGTVSGSVVTVGADANLTITDTVATAVHYYTVDKNARLWNWNDANTAGAVPYEDLTARPAKNAVVALKGGAITGGNMTGHGGGILVGSNATLTLGGGNIVGNQATLGGGGVAVGDATQTGGSLLLNAGVVCGNVELGYKGYTQCGGGVYVAANSALTMNGGDVAYNYAAVYGGGIGNRGVFKLTGGSIFRNRGSYSAGGVFTGCASDLGSAFTMTGGTISGNESGTFAGGLGSDSYAIVRLLGGSIVTNKSAKAGGVESGYGANASYTLGGDIKIFDNTLSDGTTPNNLYFYENNTVAITNDPALASTALIGVTTETKPSVEAKVAVSSNRGDDCMYFTSDEGYAVVNENDQVMLGLPVVVFNAWGGKFADGSETTNVCIGTDMKYAFPDDPTRAGYAKLEGWFLSWTNGAAKVVNGAALLAKGDHTVYAKWISNSLPEDEGEETLDFETDGDGAVLKGAMNKLATTDLVIPEFTKNGADGIPFVTIKEGAFTYQNYDRKREQELRGAGVPKAKASTNNLTSVTISTYVTNIQAYAFAYCGSLTNVTFSKTRDYFTGTTAPLHVDNWAFQYSSVKSVIFPADSKIALDYGAFADAEYLEDVYFLGDVELQAKYPFAGAGSRYVAADPVNNRVKIHLSAKLAANTNFVAALTNGMAAARIKLDQGVVGAITPKSISPSVGPNTTVTLTFSVPEDSPWQTVATDTLYGFYSTNAEDIIVGTGTVLKPATLSGPDANGVYTATFTLPSDAKSGFFTFCIGDER